MQTFKFHNEDDRTFEEDDFRRAPEIGEWVGFDDDLLLIVGHHSAHEFYTVNHPMAVQMRAAMLDIEVPREAAWKNVQRIHREHFAGFTLQEPQAVLTAEFDRFTLKVDFSHVREGVEFGTRRGVPFFRATVWNNGVPLPAQWHLNSREDGPLVPTFQWYGLPGAGALLCHASELELQGLQLGNPRDLFHVLERGIREKAPK